MGNMTLMRSSAAFFLTLMLLPTVMSCSNEKPAESNKEGHSQIKTIETMDELNRIIHSDKKMLVFDLYADWCMPCKILAPVFNSLSENYKDRAAFYRINIDKSPDIAAAFGIRGIPYIVFINDKKTIHALTGVNPKESYEKVLNRCSNAISAQECEKALD